MESGLPCSKRLIFGCLDEIWVERFKCGSRCLHIVFPGLLDSNVLGVGRVVRQKSLSVSIEKRVRSDNAVMGDDVERSYDYVSVSETELNMSLKALATSPLFGITVLVVFLAFLLRFYIKFDTAERLFSGQELALFNGSDEGLPVLLGILGSVFDVTKGKSHYGSRGGYNRFAGRDASRAFVSEKISQVIEFLELFWLVFLDVCE
ncbi:hypothetical protein VNO80_14138 [Phaseolus coccineus]|uniref:Cytochrome b5 heme-binding domain-containing protein n=1 Tax=Phaseolus coccineus TaxID=3886 RepID=A0AAN9MJ86_PHACN